MIEIVKRGICSILIAGLALMPSLSAAGGVGTPPPPTLVFASLGFDPSSTLLDVFRDPNKKKRLIGAMIEIRAAQYHSRMAIAETLIAGLARDYGLTASEIRKLAEVDPDQLIDYKPRAPGQPYVVDDSRRTAATEGWHRSLSTTASR